MSYQHNQQGSVLPLSERISPQGKMTLWKLDRRRMIAMFIGTLISIPLMHTLIYVHYYISPATALILVMGVFFGPWVGLMVGGAGALIEMLVSLQGHFDMWVAWNPWYSIRHTGFDWENIVSYALIGFIAGLSALHTQGPLLSHQALSQVRLMTIFAHLVGFAFSDICYMLIQHRFSYSMIQDDVATMYFDFVVLFLIYAALVWWKKKTKVLSKDQGVLDAVKR